MRRELFLKIENSPFILPSTINSYDYNANSFLCLWWTDKQLLNVINSYSSYFPAIVEAAKFILKCRGVNSEH